MPITLADVKNSMDVLRPPSIVLHGVEKIGKSTFGANMETPIFIRTEDGLSNISASTFPRCETWESIIECLTALSMEEHNHKTLVMDSLDWLEPILWQETCELNGKVANIEKVDGGFGKGFMAALDVWRLYFKYLDYLRDNKGMTILQLAHSKVKDVKAPDSEIYETYTMKLQDGKNATAAGLLFEYSDIILFANYQVNTVKETVNNDKNKTRARAIGTGQRFLFTEERPAFKAGNRYGLPDKIPFDKEGACWGTIKSYIPYFNQKQGV